eukprot:CAMPEP_0184496390 /NCGR_PEP_ID=MMETSP0113_2-20130426/33834_1 /TAXON_ID=91329 /ORGANISM="Norrisiella sphaerica, Strain BC52" /LENGTH=59 /DNA_ID=CAMNT_0026882995 /DNA_START=1191 /DNA_END=1370 /DNA_ORIENTATION=+
MAALSANIDWKLVRVVAQMSLNGGQSAPEIVSAIVAYHHDGNESFRVRIYRLHGDTLTG